MQQIRLHRNPETLVASLANSTYPPRTGSHTGATRLINSHLLIDFRPVCPRCRGNFYDSSIFASLLCFLHRSQNCGQIAFCRRFGPLRLLRMAPRKILTCQVPFRYLRAVPFSSHSMVDPPHYLPVFPQLFPPSVS